MVEKKECGLIETEAAFEQLSQNGFFLKVLLGNAVLTLFFYVNLILYLFSGNYTIIGYRERWFFNRLCCHV